MAMQVLDPRRHLAATCKKKQAFRMGKYGQLQGALENSNNKSIVNAIRGVEKGLDSIVGITFGTIGQVSGFISQGVSSVTEAVLGPNGADIGGSNFHQSVLKKINPAVHGRVEDAANGILSKISGGSVDSLSEFTDPFSEAVDVAANLFATPNDGSELVKCAASPYAADLIARGVKQKYLFIADFEFSDDYVTSLGDLDHAFVIKQSDRPTVNFEYEEVNLYNYRTKAIKHATYNPISMKFYDDATGQALAFYSMYLKVMSPIANLDPAKRSMDHQLLESSLGGMQFPNYAEGGNADNLAASVQEPDQNTHGTSQWAYGASIGPLHSAGGTHGKNILQRMRIFHVYGGGALMDVYTFINPKVTEMQLDELSMEDSGANEVAMTFSYDSVIVQPRLSASPINNFTKFNEYNLESLTSGKSGLSAKYPVLHYGPPIDTWHQHLAKHPLDSAVNPGTTFGDFSTGPQSVQEWGSNLTGGIKNLVSSPTVVNTAGQITNGISEGASYVGNLFRSDAEIIANDAASGSSGIGL